MDFEHFWHTSRHSLQRFHIVLLINFSSHHIINRSNEWLLCCVNVSYFSQELKLRNGKEVLRQGRELNSSSAYSLFLQQHSSTPGSSGNIGHDPNEETCVAQNRSRKQKKRQKVSQRGRKSTKMAQFHPEQFWASLFSPIDPVPFFLADYSKATKARSFGELCLSVCLLSVCLCSLSLSLCSSHSRAAVLLSCSASSYCR